MMLIRRRTVTQDKAPSDELPPWAGQGAALLLALEQSGGLSEVARRLRIRRQGGYCGLDVFVFFLYYFSAELGVGIKAFWTRAVRAGGRLFALAGRRSFPSTAAISRALGAVEGSELAAVGGWMLGVLSGADRMLQHPAALVYDTEGQGWHVFDYDPTVTALRQRALPIDADLPEATRRAAALAAPGYPGRKRGDVQFHRATLQHAGTGLWLGAWFSPGNGNRMGELDAALGTVVETCSRLGHPLERALIRMDGEFGHVPALSLCQARGPRVLTRLNRPDLLDVPEVRRRLAEGAWQFVPDTRCGPRRSALDLGIVTVPPGRVATRSDGTPYEAVTTRVVVSRFPREGEADHGRVVDGWQYELFATDAPASAWPAPETVAAYFGRGGQENRFAQEDRELGLDRIFSYHLPGQGLACLIGLLVYNLHILHGWALDTPPPEPPLPELRKPRADPRVAQVPPAAEPGAVLDTPDPDGNAAEVADQLGELHAAIAAAVQGVDWARLLRRYPGWSWVPEQSALRCPPGSLLPLTTLRDMPGAPHRPRMIFRAPTPACAACARRSDCFQSVSLEAARLVELTISAEAAAVIRPLLAPLQRLRRRAQSLAHHAAAPEPPPARRAPEAGKYAIQPDDSTPGSRKVIGPRILPARARQLFRDAVCTLRVSVHVTLAPPPLPRPTLLARDDADRAHQRASWADRVARYGLPEGSVVRVEVEGAAAGLALIGGAEMERKVA